MPDDPTDLTSTGVMDADARTPEEQIAIARGLAAHQVARLEKMSASGTEQLLKTSGWLTAALLTINGAGALATLNAVARIDAPLFPALAFGAGMLFVLLNGVAVQTIHSISAGPLEHLMAYWRAVEILGRYDEEEEEKFNRPITRIFRLAWVPPTLGWISGICFFTGIIYLTINIRA
jgi:hypothetical protein